MSDLFRPEVMQARSGQWLGGVRLAQSVPGWWLTLGASLLAALLTAYVFFGEVTRKARVGGVLMPADGLIDVAAGSAGRVAEVRVREGQTVSAGTVLFVLAVDRASGAGETGARVAEQIEARRAALQAERALRESQIRLQQQAVASRVAALDAEIRKLDDEIATAQRRRALGAQQVSRLEQLAREGFVSATQVQTQQQDLLDQDARIQQLSRAQLALRRDRQTLAAEVTQLAAQLQTDLASVERSLAALAQEAVENDARRTQVVVAPRAGTVTALALQAGQAVAPGQRLAMLAPRDSPLQAHLFAPSRTVGFVEPGQPVRLRYAAFPYQKFGLQAGTVQSVTKSAFAATELPPGVQHLALRDLAREPLYRIVVALERQHIDAYGQPQPLKAGLTLEADVMQDRRRIVEWILEPAIAVMRRAEG
jgi:membrane fusion protein